MVTPGRQYRESDHPDRSGLHIWRISGDVYVRSVDEGSPAAESVHPGDMIVQINGVGVSDTTLHGIRLLFRREKQTIAILIRRNGEDIPVTLEW